VDDALDRAEGQVDEKLLSRYPDAVQHAEALTEVLESLANRLEGTQDALDKTLEKKKDVAEEIRAVQQDGKSVFAESIDHAAGGIQKKADEILSEIRYLRRVAAAAADTKAGDDYPPDSPAPQADRANERPERTDEKEHDGVEAPKNVGSSNSLGTRGSDDDSGPSGEEPLDKGKRESGSEREPAGVSEQRSSRSAQGTRNRDVDTEGKVARTRGSAEEAPAKGSDLDDDSDADTSPPGRATQKTESDSSSGESSAGSTTETSSKERETDAESPDSSAPSRSRSWNRDTGTQAQQDPPQADQSSSVGSKPSTPQKKNDISRVDDRPDVAEDTTQNTDDTSSTAWPQEGMADENDDHDDFQTHPGQHPTDPHDSDSEEEGPDGEKEGRAEQSVSEQAKKERKSLLSRIKKTFGFD
jgi:type IV secretion system protein VirB6